MEVLGNAPFTTKADVWYDLFIEFAYYPYFFPIYVNLIPPRRSFGVLLHEIFHHGATPYEDMNNEQVVIRVGKNELQRKRERAPEEA